MWMCNACNPQPLCSITYYTNDSKNTARIKASFYYCNAIDMELRSSRSEIAN